MFLILAVANAGYKVQVFFPSLAFSEIVSEITLSCKLSLSISTNAASGTILLLFLKCSGYFYFFNCFPPALNSIEQSSSQKACVSHLVKKLPFKRQNDLTYF